MITHDDTRYFMANVSPGEHHKAGKMLIPRIGEHGGLEPEPADGDDPIHVSARRLLRNVGVFREDAIITEIAEQVMAPSLLFSGSNFDLIITDSRIVFIETGQSGDGKRCVGQIRFPWIKDIGFRPKQSLFNDAELVISAEEFLSLESFPSPETATLSHTFTFIFRKDYHPGQLAKEITQRAARYVAALSSAPKSTELTALQTVEALPNPIKGEHSYYSFPIYSKVPCDPLSSIEAEPSWEVVKER